MNDPAPSGPVVEMTAMDVAALHDAAELVLEDVNWSVQPGEFWVVAGPQHSGKSDLIVHAAGLMTPARGVCRIFGLDTREVDESHLPERRRIGVVFADSKLFNQFTIAENIALPLQYHQDASDMEIDRAVNVLLRLLELESIANLTPANLAPVWRQRAALARALALKPELLLLDNPNGGLTARHRHWLVNFLDQLWLGHEYLEGRRLTIAITTDDLRAWENPRRRFAAVHEGKFSVLGCWGETEFMRHQAILELLALPAPSERSQTNEDGGRNRV